MNRRQGLSLLSKEQLAKFEQLRARRPNSSGVIESSLAERPRAAESSAATSGEKPSETAPPVKEAQSPPATPSATATATQPGATGATVTAVQPATPGATATATPGTTLPATPEATTTAARPAEATTTAVDPKPFPSSFKGTPEFKGIPELRFPTSASSTGPGLFGKDNAAAGTNPTGAAMFGKSGNWRPSGLEKRPAEHLKFQFRYQPWKDVLDWFADQNGLSLVVAENTPKGTFNYTDSREYTPAEALDVLNSVLLIKNFVLVRRERDAGPPRPR